MASDIYTDTEGAIINRVKQTSENVFKAPERIIDSVDLARSMYSTLKTSHLKRIALYSEIIGLVQGNPPYNPQVLKEAGLDHVSNFNDMSARAIIERGCLAYWNLLHNSEYLVRFVVRGDYPELVSVADIMAQNWDFVMRNRWPSFLINIASLTSQIVTLGVSPALFPDERDPRWRTVEMNRFLVPDQAQSDLDLLTTVMVETEFTVQELWAIYEEFKDVSKKDSPWNVNEIGRLLVYIAGSITRDETGPTDIFELEKKFLSGDITYTRLYSDTVRLVSQFQKEYSGKISHYMFHRYVTGTAGAPKAENEFIFFEQGQYNTMSEGIIIFTMNPGAYTIHANLGLGHKVFSLAQAKIQMDCSVVDMAKWSSTPIIKSASLNAKDVEQIRFYPGVPTNIGTADFVENNLGANIQGVIGAASYLGSQIQFNIAYSGSDSSSPDPDTGSLSPTQTRLLAFREFSVLKNNIMHFYATFDKLVQNMTAKMLRSKKGYPGYELAQEWKERCIEDGVPPEIFQIKDSKDDRGMPRNIEVYATRAAGAGSQVAHLIGLQELQSIAGSFGVKEELEYKRQFISATVGPEYVKAFLGDNDTADEQAGGASLAGVENAIMQAGKSPIFSPDNEHRAHIAVHLALMMDTAKGLQDPQSGMDPVTADSVFNVAIPHTEEHIQAASQNPFAQAFVQKVIPAFEQVKKLAILNRKNAEEILKKQAQQQQQAEEAQAQVMSEEQLKNYTTMQDERRKDEKLAAQSQRQENAGAAKEQALATKTEGELAIKARKVEGEVANERIKTILTNKAKQEGQDNPRGELERIRGNTISPGDFEKQ